MYTVNNQTHTVDKWQFYGCIPAKDSMLCQLKNDKNQLVFLPDKCVYESETDAKKVLYGGITNV